LRKSVKRGEEMSVGRKGSNDVSKLKIFRRFLGGKGEPVGKKKGHGRDAKKKKKWMGRTKAK